MVGWKPKMKVRLTWHQVLLLVLD